MRRSLPAAVRQSVVVGLFALGAASVRAQPPPDSAHIPERDTFPAEVRPPAPLRPARDVRAPYLDQPTFQYRERPRGESIFARAWRLVREALGRWLNAATWDERYWRITVGVLAVLLAAGVARLFARYGAAGLSRRVGTAVGPDEPLPDRLDPLDLDRWLADALNAGDARRIVRVRYLRALQLLAAEGHVAYRPKATNADYLRPLSPPLRAALAPLARRFEELWYGHYPPRPSDLAEAEAAEAAVRQAVRTAGRAPAVGAISADEPLPAFAPEPAAFVEGGDGH